MKNDLMTGKTGDGPSGKGDRRREGTWDKKRPTGGFEEVFPEAPRKETPLAKKKKDCTSWALLLKWKGGCEY